MDGKFPQLEDGAPTLLGEPDLKHLRQMQSDGWAYVAPSAHPELLAMTMADAMQARAFCLMHKSTAAVQEQRARERAPHMDMDFRVLAILERFTGPKPTMRGPNRMAVSVRRRKPEGEDPNAPPPIHTVNDLRAELLKRFAEADVRLFMQRHFGV